MRICQEEIFGPFVSILSAKNLDEAIKIANSVDYGLSSAIYTSKIASAFAAIKQLQTGQTYINHPTIGSEAHLPFGGVKSSGSNRESGPEGVNEFTELKTVYINYSNTKQFEQSSDEFAGHSLYGNSLTKQKKNILKINSVIFQIKKNLSKVCDTAAFQFIIPILISQRFVRIIIVSNTVSRFQR